MTLHNLLPFVGPDVISNTRVVGMSAITTCLRVLSKALKLLGRVEHHGLLAVNHLLVNGVVEMGNLQQKVIHHKSRKEFEDLFK